MMVLPPSMKAAVQKRSFLLTYCQLLQFSVSAYLALRYMKTWEDSVVFGAYAAVMFFLFSDFLWKRGKRGGSGDNSSSGVSSSSGSKKVR